MVTSVVGDNSYVNKGMKRNNDGVPYSPDFPLSGRSGEYRTDEYRTGEYRMKKERGEMRETPGLMQDPVRARHRRNIQKSVSKLHK